MAADVHPDLGPRRVRLRRRSLERYRAIVDEVVGDVRDLARDLRGLRVLELSSTATGGRVAEMLGSLAPLERDVGLDAEWRLLSGDPHCFRVTESCTTGCRACAAPSITRSARPTCA